MLSTMLWTSVEEGKRHMSLYTRMLSCFSHVCFVTLWTVARQALLSMGLYRQEYWSRLPCPPPGDLPDPGIESASPAASAFRANSLPLRYQGSPKVLNEVISKSTSQSLTAPTSAPSSSQGRLPAHNLISKGMLLHL